MAAGRTPLDPKRWFDRMQPQTLQIATWLLYLNGFFMFIDLVDARWGGDFLSYYRWRFGAAGIVVGIATIALHIGGAWLMANDRRLGWKLAVVGSFAPFVLRIMGYEGVDFYTRLTGGSTLSAIFEIALCALVLHPHSRQHQKIWYR